MVVQKLFDWTFLFSLLLDLDIFDTVFILSPRSDDFFLWILKVLSQTQAPDRDYKVSTLFWMVIIPKGLLFRIQH